jgi:hypothetical protein
LFCTLGEISMTQPEQSYLLDRARAERKLAEQASCAIARSKHIELAQAYEARVKAPPATIKDTDIIGGERTPRDRSGLIEL